MEARCIICLEEKKFSLDNKTTKYRVSDRCIKITKRSDRNYDISTQSEIKCKRQLFNGGWKVAGGSSSGQGRSPC